MANVPYQLLVIEGTTEGGDVWSTSLKTTYGDNEIMPFAMQQKFLSEGTTTIPGQTSIVGGLFSLIGHWWLNTNGFAQYTSTKFASVFRLTRVKFNSIGTGGKYQYLDSCEIDVSGAPQGPENASGISPRSSLVVTTRTDIGRGRGAYGRMYWPANGACYTVGGTPYVATATAEQQRDKALVLIKAINDMYTVDDGFERDSLDLRVSHVYNGIFGAPAASPVVAVEVDRIVDTQRRRTNRIPRAVVSDSL